MALPADSGFRRHSPQRGNPSSAMHVTATPTTGRLTTPPVRGTPISGGSFMGTASSPTASASQLDIVFDGTWVIAPTVDGTGKIVSVDIYSPACGHPQGVTFASGLNPSPWPDSSSFYQLDSHSHTLSIQRSNGSKAGMALSGIDAKSNHCLTRPPRPFGGSWDLLVSI